MKIFEKPVNYQELKVNEDQESFDIKSFKSDGLGDFKSAPVSSNLDKLKLKRAEEAVINARENMAEYRRRLELNSTYQLEKDLTQKFANAKSKFDKANSGEQFSYEVFNKLVMEEASHEKNLKLFIEKRDKQKIDDPEFYLYKNEYNEAKKELKNAEAEFFRLGGRIKEESKNESKVATDPRFFYKFPAKKPTVRYSEDQIKALEDRPQKKAALITLPNLKFKLINNLKNYIKGRASNKKEYYGLQAWGRFFNGFTGAEKVAVAKIVLNRLEGNKTEPLDPRQIQALNNGDLYKIYGLPENKKLIDELIDNKGLDLSALENVP